VTTGQWRVAPMFVDLAIYSTYIAELCLSNCADLQLVGEAIANKFQAVLYYILSIQRQRYSALNTYALSN
jgi:hypothetical protein